MKRTTLTLIILVNLQLHYLQYVKKENKKLVVLVTHGYIWECNFQLSVGMWKIFLLILLTTIIKAPQKRGMSYREMISKNLMPTWRKNFKENQIKKIY